jgi:hypothetical protein
MAGWGVIVWGGGGGSYMMYYKAKYGIMSICIYVVHCLDCKNRIVPIILLLFFPFDVQYFHYWYVVLHVCPVSSMCCAKFEFCFFVLMALCAPYNGL